jgi:hypothetical protein
LELVSTGVGVVRVIKNSIPGVMPRYDRDRGPDEETAPRC